MCFGLSAHAHTVLTAVFPGEPELAGCPLILLTMGSGAKFNGPDALPGVNQQKRTGLHPACIHYDSWREEA